MNIHKKTLLLCVSIVCFCSTLSAQFVEITSPGFTFVGMHSGTDLSGITDQINASLRSSAFFDYDEDGDLDILVSEYGAVFDVDGTSTDGNYKLYQNNRGSSFTEITTALLGLENPTNSFGDYDNDGYIDVFSGGYFWGETTEYRFAALYRNGSGTGFSIDTTFAGVRDGTSAFVDYDNDGDLDLFVSGEYGLESGFNKLASYFYKNTGGVFSKADSLEGVRSGSCLFEDYDNDGDKDLFLCGNNGTNKIFDLYNNNRTGFSRVEGTSFVGVDYSSLSIGDYDKDGYIDILATGSSTSGMVSTLYRNKNGKRFSDVGVSFTGVRRGGGRFIDYDNDGDLDIFLSGEASSGDITKLYQNNAGVFTEKNTQVTAVRNAYSVFGDYDNDGDMDLFLRGFDNSYDINISKLYRNDTIQNVLFTTNSSPSLLMGLHSSVSGDSVLFSWNRGLDNQTAKKGLSYNLYIRNGTNIIRTSHSFGINGKRSIPQRGKVQDTFLLVKNIPAGVSEWGVQSIDGSFVSSNWATGTFSITASDVPIAVIRDNFPTEFTLVWNRVSVATAYELDISTDAGFQTFFYQDTLVNQIDTTQRISSLTEGVRYYYRIRSVVSGGYSHYNQSSVIFSNRFTALTGSGYTFSNETSYSTAFGDYDSDGDLDFVLTTDSDPQMYENVSGIFSRIYSGSFSTVSSANRVGFIDFDNDKKLDLFFQKDNSTTLYKNNGTGFSIFMGATFVSVDLASLSFGDYNNDGYVDIFLTGNNNTNLISKLYKNNRGTGFTEVTGNTFTGVRYGSSSFGDYDNDGDLDLFLLGDTYSNNIGEIYKNTEGIFIKEITVLNKERSGAYLHNVCVDYDKDGDLDILVIKKDASEWYVNTSGSFVKGDIFVGDYKYASFGDINNDGYLDMFLTKQTSSHLYKNNKTGFSEIIHNAFNGFTEGSSHIVDYDNDGDLDIFVAGGNSQMIYRNELLTKPFSPNTPPSAPTHLSEEKLSNRSYRLKWSSALDDKTSKKSLQYNIYIGTSPSKRDSIRSAHSFTDDGTRKILFQGLISDTSYVLQNQAPRDYYWSVQAIDGSLAGGTWATERIYNFAATKDQQTISFTNLTKTFGDPPFILANTNSGLLISYSSSSSIVSFSKNSISIIGTGTASITAYNNGNAFTLAEDSTVILTIHKAAQSISFETITNKTFGDAPFIISASASSSLAVVFSASNTLININNSTVTINGAGTVRITAYQTGNNNYDTVSAIQTFSIHKVKQTLSFETITNKTFGNAPFIISASASSSLAVVFSASNTLININNSTVTINGAGTVRITAYQTGNNNYDTVSAIQTFSIHKVKQTLSFETITNKTFGDAPFIISASASSSLAVVFSASNTLININNSTVTINGAGTVRITAYQTGNNNYDTVSAIQTFSIHKVKQTLSFETITNKTFGDAPFIIIASASSSLAVVFSASNTLININNNTVTINGAGTVRITAYQTGNNNYDTVSAIQTFSIHKVKQTLSFETITNKTFGDAPFIISASASSSLAVVFSASNTLININNNTVTINGAGTVRITAYQTGNNNYDTVSAIQTFSIHKVKQTLSFETITNKTFGDAPFIISASASSSLAVVFSASNTLININNNTVTINGAGTVRITAYQTGNNNYDTVSAIQTFSIHKVKQTLSFETITNKTFGDAPFTISASASSSLAVVFSASNTLININNNTVTINGAGTVRITAYQTGNNNYDTVSAIQTFSIHKVKQTLSFETITNKTIGDAPFIISASASSSLAVVFSASNTLININNNTVTINGAGTVRITAYQTGNNNYDTVSAIQTFSIHKVKQTLSFETITNKTIGDAPFIISASASSLLAVVFSASNTLININNSTVTINGAGTVRITAYQIGNNNYDTVSAIQTFSIHKVKQTLSFETITNKTFGDAPFIITASASSSLAVVFSASNTLININNSTVTINGAGTVRITAYQTGNNNYDTVSAIQTFSIHKVKQTLSFETITNKTIGDAPFIISASASSLLAVVFSASNTLININNSTVTINGAGTVRITAYQTGNNNYLRADSVFQTFTIHKAAQSISFETITNKTFGDAPFIITASASSSLAVVFSASNTLININNSTVTINGAGTVRITAYQTGNNNYLRADSVFQTFTIHKAAQSISFETITNKTFGDAPFIITASASSSLAVVFSASNTLININNNTVTINGAGTVRITAYQTGNNNYLRADSVFQTFTIHKAAQSISFETITNKTIGDAPFIISASASSSLAVVFSASNTLININNNTVTINGAGTVRITAYQTGNNNYDTVSAIQTFSIHKVKQTLSFETITNKTIGDAPFIISASASSLLAVVFSASNTLININNNTVTINGAGTVRITAYQTGNNNYLPAPSFSQILTILPKNSPLTPIKNTQIQIKIYPNPAQKKLTIQQNNISQTPITLAIINLNQQLIHQQTLSFEGKTYSQINIEHIPNNTYILILSNQNQEILLIEKLQINNE